MMLGRLHRMTRRWGLPTGLWAAADGTGLVARTDRLGGVRWLGWCVDGAHDGGRFLELEPWRRSGVLRVPNGSGGTEDREEYRLGRVEVFHAWSDGQPPSWRPWLSWTRHAVAEVVVRVRCELCRERLPVCRPGACDADAQAFVCVDCLRAAGPPAPRAWPLGERRCGFCGAVQADHAPIHESRGGCLCARCMAAAQERFHSR